MRKTSAVLASLSLALLALTGCTAAPTYAGESCDRTTSANGIDEAVTVSGEVGTAPEVSIFAPLHLDKTSFTDVVTGDGRAIVNEQQPVILEITFYDGTTGEKLYATSYDEATAQVSNIAGWAAKSAGLGDVLKCATAGSRVVAGVTAEGFGEANVSGFNLSEDDSVVFVIDVVDVMLARAEGSQQFNDARGVPTVVRAADGTPGVIIPDSAAPTAQVEQTLIKGDGDKVTADQVPILNVLSVNWDDRSIVANTWGSTPNLDLQTSAPDVAKALVGKPVGSQVLVVTPATKDAGAVAYVIDVLGAVTPTQ